MCKNLCQLLDMILQFHVYGHCLYDVTRDMGTSKIIMFLTLLLNCSFGIDLKVDTILGDFWLNVKKSPYLRDSSFKSISYMVFSITHSYHLEASSNPLAQHDSVGLRRVQLEDASGIFLSISKIIPQYTFWQNGKIWAS